MSTCVFLVLLLLNKPPFPIQPVSSFKLLTEDQNIKMVGYYQHSMTHCSPLPLLQTYETRPNMLYNGQVTVAVIFQWVVTQRLNTILFLCTFRYNPPLSCSNLTDHQLVSLDFNVLDSLNTKLERPVSDTCSLHVWCYACISDRCQSFTWPLVMMYTCTCDGDRNC